MVLVEVSLRRGGRCFAELHTMCSGVRSNQIIIITFYRHNHYNLCVGSTVRGRRGGLCTITIHVYAQRKKICSCKSVVHVESRYS